MAADAIMQERIYTALKRDLLSDGQRPGRRLDLQFIADLHRASTTPVREAIHRLMGEGLLEAHGDGGFQIVLPTLSDLLDLYGWNVQHLLSAVHVSRGPPLHQALSGRQRASIGDSPGELAEAQAELFEAIGRATGNGEFLRQVEAVNSRLFQARVAEVRYFGDVDRELRVLTKTDGPNVQSGLRRRLLAFHRRRIEHAAQLLTMLRDDGRF